MTPPALHLPAWCDPPSDARLPPEILAQALAAATSGVVWLRGEPEGGVSAALGAVARAIAAGRPGARVVALRAHDTLRLADARRAIAYATDTFPVSALDRALAPGWIGIVDDADRAPALADELRDAFPGATWVLGGRAPGPGISLPARPAATVEPPAGLELYGGVPMGAPGYPPLVIRPWCVPGLARTTLRRSVAERLGGGAIRGESLAASLRDDLERVHRLVGDVDLGHDPDDITWLRACAEHVLDADLAVLAAVAEARLLLRWNAVDEADAALALARERTGRGATADALLAWLTGDALTARGRVDEAERAHRQAFDQLSHQGLHDAATALGRRAAEELVRRGFAARSRRWSALAREAAARSGQPAAWADTLRLAAEAASASGESVGAETLLDEAEAMARRAPEPDAALVALTIARAGLEVARGATGTADELLAGVNAPPDAPLCGPSLAWRRAELALRQGRRDQAAISLGEARDGYRRDACLRGLRLVARLDGDRRALDGDVAGALAAWSDALEAALADRDLDGARRMLRRMLAVERHSDDTARQDALRERLSLVEAALRMR